MTSWQIVLSGPNKTQRGVVLSSHPTALSRRVFYSLTMRSEQTGGDLSAKSPQLLAGAAAAVRHQSLGSISRAGLASVAICLHREVLTFKEQRAALLFYFANQNQPGVSEVSAIPAESCLVMPGVYACETECRGGSL